MFRVAKVASMTIIAVAMAAADPVPVTLGQWTEFGWLDGTELGSQIDFPEDGFLFDLSTSIDVNVRVTDRGASGDAFDIYVDGELRSQTPSVEFFPDPAGLLFLPDDAWEEPRLSKTTFLLTGGAEYIVTIHVREKAEGFGSGGAYLRGDLVPEPSTYALLGGGLLLLGVIARRRKRA